MEFKKLTDEEIASICAGSSGSVRVQDIVRRHEEDKRRARENYEVADEDLADISGGKLYPQLENVIREGAIYALYHDATLDEALACLDDLEGRFSPEDLDSMRDIIRSVYCG